MKRRYLALLLAVLILAGTVVAPVGACAASKSKVWILKVNTDGARIRKGPSSDYDIVTSVKKGTRVVYLNSMKKSFARICTEYGTVGYMYRGFLSSYGVCYRYQLGYSKSGSVTVYKKPSTGSKRATKLSRHQIIVAYQVKGDWVYIKTLGGTGGFVQKKYLKAI